MATKEAVRTVWRSERVDSDAGMSTFLSSLGDESADRAKIINAPWGYAIFYPVSE